MKTVLTKFLAIGSIGLLMLASCKKEGVKVMSNGGKPGNLTANTTDLPLDKSKVNDTSKVITFDFTKANFGYTAAVTNTLQIDAQGDSWANPTTFTKPNGVYKQSFNTFDFNNLVLKLNLTAGVPSPINVRIVHSLGANVPPVYSNTLSLTVTPFNLTSWVYVVGAFDGRPSLSANGTDSLISATGNGVYTGIINFPANANEFLILPQSNNYNNKYASTQAPNAGPTSTVTQNGPNNLSAPKTGGQYIVNFNSNTGVISFTAADFYSIIGSATPGGNWSTDMNLKFVNDGNNIWTGTFTLLAGEFKFRQSGQWTNSWGIPQAGHEGAGVPNTLNDTHNDNIPVTAGTHTVTFVQAPTPLGTTPTITTTYSLQ